MEKYNTKVEMTKKPDCLKKNKILTEKILTQKKKAKKFCESK